MWTRSFPLNRRDTHAIRATEPKLKIPELIGLIKKKLKKINKLNFNLPLGDLWRWIMRNIRANRLAFIDFFYVPPFRHWTFSSFVSRSSVATLRPPINRFESIGFKAYAKNATARERTGGSEIFRQLNYGFCPHLFFSGVFHSTGAIPF